MKNKISISFFLVSILLFNIIHVSKGQTGSNPIYRDAFTADPSPLLHNGTMYVYVGHDEAYNGEASKMTGWLCYSTTDMKNWTSHGAVMKPTDFKWASKDAWASQVVERGGKFYLFVTVTASGQYSGRCIGVGVSDKPTGPFVDAIGAPLVYDKTTPGREAWDDIDPTVWLDDDGSAYLFWGNGTCYFAKLKSSLLALDGDVKMVTPANYEEGPWIHKYKGMYYLTYAAFVPPNGNEQLCYSTATNINGPWTYRGILTGQGKSSFTIHPGIIEYKGQWYLFYHNVTLTLNGQAGNNSRRSVAVDYLCYNSDGTMKTVTQTTAGITASLLCPTKAPYGGTPWPIPGKIQAENYDFGGEGSGFHELTGDGNLGGSAYRGGDQVDVETCTDVGGGYNLGYTLNGEWLEYTVNVTTAGNYDLDFRIACNGTDRAVSVSMDGTIIAKNVVVPNTGGWQTWLTTTVKDIPLTAGKKVMRLTIGGADYVNLNYVEFKKSVVTGLEKFETLELGLYPNPFDGNGLKIKKEGGFHYKISDMSGSILEQGIGENEQLIGTNMKSGVYLLSVENDNGVFVQKIVKQ